LFPKQAAGSLIERDGKPVGSLLIAQPFKDDKFFQPRPSATTPGYNATASTPSNLAGNNYALRDRVAQQLGPIAAYAGPKDEDGADVKKGTLVGTHIEAWFQKDQFGGQKGIVSQWANLHNNSAQNWIKNDMTNGKYGLCGQYVQDWQKTHKAEVAAESARIDQWKKDHPDKPTPEPEPKPWVTAWISAISDPATEPKPEDLAVSFFIWFSDKYPGTFPSPETQADGKTKLIKPLGKSSNDQTDVQAIFFDMWLTDLLVTENKKVALEPVPGDAVTTSGSGLDPHITYDNAIWQLDNPRVGGGKTLVRACAEAKFGDKATAEDEAKVRETIIEDVLNKKRFSPLGGLVGVSLVNVLEVNQAIADLYPAPATEAK
jgi:K+-transporting ATPase ATPase C chain